MVLGFGLTGCGDKTSGETKPDSTPTDTSSQVSAPADDTSKVSISLEEAMKTGVEETAEITPPEAGKNGVLIHLSEGPQDRFKVCMALKIAEDMAAKNVVLVYLDHRGTELAFKSTEDFEYSPFPKYKEEIKKLKSMGVRITVCEPCLSAYFKKANEVMPEIEVVNPADISDFTSGRVMTLYY